MSRSDSQEKLSESDEQYVKLTHREHVLTRPDSYIGSIEPRECKMWVCNEDGKFEFREISYVPGLYKIFDEILVNAADNKQRDPPLTTIKVEVDPAQNRISVWNDGKGISTQKQFSPNDNCEYYIPEFIFSQLLTSSNYNDKQEKVTGGRNGYGAKLANIFSKKFHINIYNADEGINYQQTITDNMTNIQPPKLKNGKGKGSYTEISFWPDLERFNLQTITKDHVDLIRRRVYDLAGILPKVKIFWNGNQVPIKKWEDYCKVYLKEDVKPLVCEVKNEKGYTWKIGVAPSKSREFQQISFVNCVATSNGGTHVDVVVNQITKYITDYLKNRRSGKVETKPSVVKNFLYVFVDSLVINPSFDSQTKERLTLDQKKLKDDCKLPDNFLDKILKTDIVALVTEYANFKEQRKVANMKGTKKGRLIINKLEDANMAGKAESLKCTLILTEGDSAKATAVTGLATIGRDYYGVFPLRGKLLNTRDISAKKLSENDEIQNIIKIMGLDPMEKYENDDSMKRLRYGSIMIMADQDVDGSHIKGLIINFVHSMWPNLLKKRNFITEFITPIVKVTKGNNKKGAISFFTIPEFSQWKAANNNGKGYKMKYYKGLATSTAEEAKEYFSNISKHKKVFIYTNENDEERINLAFAKKRADDRKNWLAQLDANETYLGTKDTHIKYSDFVDKELILFSSYANYRAIPSSIDGWKPGQRKILWVCLKNNIKNDLKVAQLSGKVSEQAAYHHGEASLNETIIGMCQDFVGSNNINVFQPIGMLGTRLAGGEDSGSPRYVYTALEKITRTIFMKEDDDLLTYNTDEGLPIEPVTYIPIIPMVLVNGAKGIGVGWSSEVPQYCPQDIIDNLRRKMNDEPMVEMTPWYSGFTGKIIPIQVIKDGVKQPIVKWESRGIVKKIDDTTIEITELPIGIWTYDYKKFLEGLTVGESLNPHKKLADRKAAAAKAKRTKKKAAAGDDPVEQADVEEKVNLGGPKISEFREYHTNVSVHFIITVDDSQMREIESVGLREFFKLKSSITATNMTLFNAQNKIVQFNSPLDIINDYYPVRMKYYEERHRYLIDALQLQYKKLSNQARFIREVIAGIIKVNGVPRATILAALERGNYDLYDDKELTKRIKFADEVIQQHNEEEEEQNEFKSESNADHLALLEKGYDYLLAMKIWTLTKEKADKLDDEAKKKNQELEEMLKKKPIDFYKEDLDKFEVEWKAFEAKREKTRLENVADAEKVNRKSIAKNKKAADQKKAKQQKKDAKAKQEAAALQTANGEELKQEVENQMPTKEETVVQESDDDIIVINEDVKKPKKERKPKAETTTPTKEGEEKPKKERKPRVKKEKKEGEEETEEKKPAATKVKKETTETETKKKSKTTKKSNKSAFEDEDEDDDVDVDLEDSDEEPVETIASRLASRRKTEPKKQAILEEFFSGKKKDGEDGEEEEDEDDDQDEDDDGDDAWEDDE
ncbi:topoisomerase II [Trichomonas vaginalis G3]|uniref:DNA topoisomerase 2 n=1 Tax=Trichomonas vaginalis (strain ATCC PRA-98 / G3) TaxID=412133 RepID=A2E5K0_TRIV3|nr:DNA topoisomerase II [Trichomonas vaginalis G3]EAY12041.1 topoisomerase II [Trichomonas vaginalis G3]KAI5553275.1 DNA topoisomerase II [Trichomonas vaginalis G3]|eukprot:XP_001324264.1 topoisomerase II [Trichomonas vaginalis G3]